MIVALGHKKSVGKTKTANFLMSYLKTNYGNLDVRLTSFSNPLKVRCYQLFGHLGVMHPSFYEINYQLKDVPLPCGKTPRDIWIHVAASLREIDNEIFVSLLEQEIKKNTMTIIYDLRDPIEWQMVKNNGGLCVRVDRNTGLENDGPDSWLDSFTEWDLVINNNGSFADLMNQVEVLACRLMEKYHEASE